MARMLPIARDELMAKARPIYLSSIILLRPCAAQGDRQLPARMMKGESDNKDPLAR